jgi:hypothetical protein
LFVKRKCIVNMSVKKLKVYEKINKMMPGAVFLKRFC